MLRARIDLQEIVEAVEIRSADCFYIAGERFDLQHAEGGLDALPSQLASALYQRMYCRPARGTSWPAADTRAMRVFVDELSKANCGSGTWEPGWVVEAVADNGALVVHKERDGLTLWARDEQFRATCGIVGVGSVGRLRLGKELREMLPGYYVVLGDADQGGDEGGRPVPIVRFYWHLTAAASPTWIRELTSRFNTARVPFHAKVLSSPNAYLRADAGVLYLGRPDLADAMALLPDLHMAVSRHLRPSTPMFTKRLARGLATAEDPGDGRSFGQHRCRLVAEGLVHAFDTGRTSVEDVAGSVAACFAQEGLVITRPWLNSGSQDCYAWPPRQRLAHA